MRAPARDHSLARQTDPIFDSAVMRGALQSHGDREVRFDAAQGDSAECGASRKRGAMMSNAKCALALVGGYALGRTRKAKAAIGVGLWLSGRKYHTKDVLRDQVVRLMRSTEGEQLINQIKGPAIDAGRRAATGMYEAQLDRLTGALAERTERLTATLGGSEKAPGKGAEAVRESGEGEAASGAPDRIHDGDRESEAGTGHTADQRDSDEPETGFAERRVRGRSPGPRRDARREPREGRSRRSLTPPGDWPKASSH